MSNIEQMPSTEPTGAPGNEHGASPGSMTMPAVAQDPDSGADGPWVALKERLPFVFNGIFLGTVIVRSMTLFRQLGQPPLPINPSLFGRIPESARALHISGQTISAKLPRVSLLSNGLCYVLSQDKRFFIDLSGSFEAYLGKLNKRWRYTIRRKLKLFSQIPDGVSRWREYRSPTDIAEFYHLAGEVFRKTWQHRQLRWEMDASQEELISRATGSRSRGYILFHEQTPIAYILCQAWHGDLVLRKVGFDQLFGSESPGSVLLWLVIEQLFTNTEFRRLDFGVGAMPYKAHFATGSIEAAEIYCFPWNFRNVALVFSHAALNEVATAVRSTLQALGVAQRLKKMIRYVMTRRSERS
jgi:hypothetical protein